MSRCVRLAGTSVGKIVLRGGRVAEGPTSPPPLATETILCFDGLNMYGMTKSFEVSGA